MELGKFHHPDEKCLKNIAYEDNVILEGIIEASMLDFPIIGTNRLTYRLYLMIFIRVFDIKHFVMIFLHVLEMEFAEAG